EQLAATRDLAERSGGRRSPRDLTHLQQQLMRTGMDSQIVAADIVRYAQDEASWRRDILDFNEVPPPAVAQQMTSQASLANTMPPATPTPSSSSSLRTWTGYVARGQGPQPDRRDTRTGRPGWAATTVDA